MSSENLPLPQKRATLNADLLRLWKNRGSPPTRALELRDQCDRAVAAAERDGAWSTAAATLQKIYAEQVHLLQDAHEDSLRASQYLGLYLSAGGDPAKGAQLLADL